MTNFILEIRFVDIIVKACRHHGFLGLSLVICPSLVLQTASNVHTQLKNLNPWWSAYAGVSMSKFWSYTVVLIWLQLRRIHVLVHHWDEFTTDIIIKNRIKDQSSYFGRDCFTSHECPSERHEFIFPPYSFSR